MFSLKTIFYTISKIRKYGVPSHILSFGDSLGDNLLLTTLAKALCDRGYKNVWIKCDHGSLFENNPYVRAILPYNTLLSTAILNLLGVKLISPVYTTYDRHTDRDEVPEKHIVLKMADCLGLKGEIHNKPILNLTPYEQIKGSISTGHIVIATSNSSAKISMTNKEWNFERYQEVVNQLHDKVSFIQLGSLNDPKLNYALDLRGKTTLRESAAILKNARLAISHVGFMMHLARAANCPAVIIYGGREMPVQSGYACFTNIYNGVPCAPCWLHNRCGHDKICMWGITVDVVVDAVLNSLQKRTSLTIDVLNNG